MSRRNRNYIYLFTATTTTQRLFRNNSKRKAFLILNNGSNIVELLSSEKGAYGDGFPISPTNAVDDDHFNPQGELFVVATTGDTELRVWEILNEEEN